MKTKAAIIEAKNTPLLLEEVELADPGPGDVCIKIEACGICRSDLHAIDGGEGVTFPAVLGHEAAGIVAALGSGVQRLREGDRVILSWTPACGRCPPCLRDEVQLCQRLRMSTGTEDSLSWNGRGLDRFMGLGAFREYVVIPEGMAIPFSGEIPAAHACLIGCAVIGCGGVGLSAIQGARVAGASMILAIDPIEERRQAALHVGASVALDIPDAVGNVLEATGGGVEVAIECVGRSEAMLDAFNMIRPGGRAVVVGLPNFNDTLNIPAIVLLATEKSIKGSIYGSAHPMRDFPRLVSLYDQGKLDLATLIGKTRPLSEVNEGIAEMRQGNLTRVVLTF
ncbi:MAG: alcohol dehydrogenase catalytic domain-containing protein [Candidatus Hydrogenedentes bacterium]|nr:alcohol dehydrogenase catalytic domain-containing protein [Candidatus Hydrogenedentota bacterium]